MSQHLLSTQCNGRSVVVLMGWDRPLQGFFLQVAVDDTSADNEEYIYSNLDDPKLARWMGLPPTLDPFLVKLRELGVKVPARMIEEVLADGKANVGSRYVTYAESGEIIS